MKELEFYARFNLANQLKFKEKSIFPKQHAYPHLKNVESNMNALIDVYPEFHSELIETYESLKNARLELCKGAMWHDLLKVCSSSSRRFNGLGHGEALYFLWENNKSPIDFHYNVAQAIRVHDSNNLITIEDKLLATADRLDFSRFHSGVDESKLPLSDAMERLKSISKRKIIKDLYFTSEIQKDIELFDEKYSILHGEVISNRRKECKQKN